MNILKKIAVLSIIAATITGLIFKMRSKMKRKFWLLRIAYKCLFWFGIKKIRSLPFLHKHRKTTHDWKRLFAFK